MVEGDNAAADPLDSFPGGITLLYATFSYSGMHAGTRYQAEWLLNGKVQPELGVSEAWSSAASGNWWVSISTPKGLLPGDYQLTPYPEARQVPSAKTTRSPPTTTQAPSPPTRSAHPPHRPPSSPALLPLERTPPGR